MTRDITQPLITSCSQYHSSGARDCTKCRAPNYTQSPDDNRKEDTSISCFNCNTQNTPLWRRDSNGKNICNACGLYYKLHLTHRPVTMMRSVIRRRKRGSDRKRELDRDCKKIKSVATIKMVHTIPPPQQQSYQSPHFIQQQQQQQQQQQKDQNLEATHHTKKLTPVVKSFPPPALVDVTSRQISTTFHPSSSATPSTSPSLPNLTYHHHHHHHHQQQQPQSTNVSSSTGPCQHIQNQQEKRQYLQNEVTRLTRLLDETTAMLSSVDKALKDSTPTPSNNCSQCQRPSQEQQVAQSLLSLAQSQSSSRFIIPSAPSSPPSTPSSSPSLSPPLTLSPSSIPTSPVLPLTGLSSSNHHQNQDYPKLPPIMVIPRSPPVPTPSSCTSLLPTISALHSR